MANIVYQLSPNLFLDGNKVFSYKTHVADINDNILEVFGKYSRTTSKHIYHTAKLFSLDIVINPDKQKRFYKFDLGVQLEHSHKCLSRTTSLFILGKLGLNPSREKWFNHLGQMPKIPGADWSYICMELGIDMRQKQPISSDPCFVTI